MTAKTRPFVHDLSGTLVATEATIDAVVRAIDRAAIGIALLVDERRRLVATITDGDVRRAMLAGVGFDQPAGRLLELKRMSSHPTPVSRPAEWSDDDLLRAMRDAQIQHIPLLDDEGRVVDVALLDRLVDARENDVSAVVMAGGFGARLRPFTDETPKPMLPVGDKPLLERTIDQLRAAGITEVSITTHYLHDKIADHFGTGSGFGVNVHYVREDRPLGTAGALGLIARPQSTMLVINGDILTTIDFRAMTAFHRANAADLTVAVRLYEVKVPYGVVDCAGVQVTGVREKPTERYFVNAGIYLVEPRVWDFITGGEPLDMPQVIERAITAGGSVVSFPLREYWLDIGRPDDYRRAQEDVEFREARAMTWQGRKALVTGAGGFIASHLAEELVRYGARTRALVRYVSDGRRGFLDESPVNDDIEIISGDIADRDSIAAAMRGVDVVFHLAALIAIPYSYHAPESYVRTNVMGTLNVLQVAREQGVSRVIHTSTSEVYGTARRVPIDEDHPLQGQSPYSASKIGADKIAESFHAAFAQPVVIVRPFNTYGPRQSARAVIPTIIGQCLAGDTVTLGALAPTRDFTYVADTVSGFLHAATAARAVGETINLGTGREISIGDLAALIARLIGKSVTIEQAGERMRPRDSEVEQLRSDNSKAARLLDWRPEVSLEEGLRRTIAWVTENPQRVRGGSFVL